MHPLNPAWPVAALVKAVTFPFKAAFVVGLCYFVNGFTSPGHWWAHWVAFGLGIALLCVWARALKALVATAGVAGDAWLAYRWWNGRRADG